MYTSYQISRWGPVPNYINLLLPQYKLECLLDLGTDSKICCRQNTRGHVVCQEVVPLQPPSGFSDGQELSFKIIVRLDVCTKLNCIATFNGIKLIHLQSDRPYMWSLREWAEVHLCSFNICDVYCSGTFTVKRHVSWHQFS
jgi:hypothetical protein